LPSSAAFFPELLRVLMNRLTFIMFKAAEESVG